MVELGLGFEIFFLKTKYNKFSINIELTRTYPIVEPDKISDEHRCASSPDGEMTIFKLGIGFHF